MVDPLQVRPSSYVAVQESKSKAHVIMQIHEIYKKKVKFKEGENSMYFFRGLGLDMQKQFDIRFDIAIPIKVNQDILLSCGFVDLGDRLRRPDEEVSLRKQTDGKYAFFSESMNMLIKAHLIYLHEIQNVWLDMVGTDMTIKLTEDELYTMFGVKTGV